MSSPTPLWRILPLLLTTVLAQGASIDIVNPGFEDVSGESPYNEFTFGPLTGWELYDSGDPTPITSGGDGPTYFIGTLRPEIDPIGNPGVYEFFSDGAPEGERVGIAFNFFGSGGGGEYGLRQTLSATLQAHTSYTLQVLVGNIASGTAFDGTPYDLSGFPGYRIDLMAGSEVLDFDDDTISGGIPEGEFALRTVTFTTGATHDLLGENLAIRLVNLNTIDLAHEESDLEVDFDNVSLTAETVPEPGSLTLLAAAGVALMATSSRQCAIRRRG